MSEIRIATRGSTLAMTQATRVADLLSRNHPHRSIRLVEVVTQGDRDTTSDIAALTEIGAFVNAVQEAVLDGRADLAVHSLKDLPVTATADLVLAAFPERVSPFDVLVGKSLADLESGARVGTGSPRRSAQIRRLRPDVETVGLRGNVDTRVRKTTTGEVDAAVLAAAGLERMGLSDRISQQFTVGEMVPSPGQGALAVETRPDTEAEDLAATIDDPQLRLLLTAERELLAQTQAGCRSALGAYASRAGERIRMDLFVEDDRGSRKGNVEADDVADLVDAAREELGL